MLEKARRYFILFSFFGLALCGFSSQVEAQGTCVPASLLATDEHYSLIEERLIEISSIGVQMERGAQAEEHEELRKRLHDYAEKSDALGAEARCWLSRLGLAEGEPWSIHRSLGPLRLDETGLQVLDSLKHSMDGLSLALRLPEVGGWPVLARSILESSLLASTPDSKTLQAHHDSLILAARRWPGPIRLWLEGAKIRHLREPYLRELVEMLGIDVGKGDLPSSQPDFVLPVLLPTGGPYAIVGKQMESFLRFVAVQNQLNIWIRTIAEEGDVAARLDELMSGGSRALAMIGPVVRRDLDLAFSSDSKPIYWFGFRSGTEVMPWIRLGSTTADVLLKHAELMEKYTEEEGLAAPVLILGRPGKRLEHWTNTAQNLWPEDEITALSYEPGQLDLTAYAEMIAHAKPGTLILAAPKADVGNLLRFLARAGIWARRDGKAVEEGEHHPFILAPPWFIQDPALTRTNRFYLDGVRVVSDLPPVHVWTAEPLVAQFRKAYGMPPLIGLRAAAVLTRLASFMETEKALPLEGSDWLDGDSPWGRLRRVNSSLTFELQSYIFAGQKFRKETPPDSH